MAEDPNEQWRDALSRAVALEPFDPMSARAVLDVSAASVCGMLRPHNTDHFLAIRLGRTEETLVSSLRMGDLPARFEEFAYALMVADGLGDRGSGARASRVALSTLAHLAIRHAKWNVRVDPEAVRSITSQGEFFYRQVHEAVASDARADERLSDMATSLTAIYVAGADLFFAHVGHSRAFLFREGTLTQLTTDHTVARRPARQAPPGPTPLLRRKTDFGHEITGSLGSSPDPEVDIEHVELVNGDRLMLCTNGLTDAVSDTEIAGVLTLKRRPEDDCQRLIDLAMSARAADDVTVMVADYRLRS